MAHVPESLRPLQRFCRTVDSTVTRMGDPASPEASLLAEVRDALAGLISGDNWLPEASARADVERYQQHPLYRDPEGRFSVVSFVWGPGQDTPIHDHGVWGLVGVLRGAEHAQRYELGEDGRPLPTTAERLMKPGDIEVLTPADGDIHRVANAFDDRASISIHVYGADIGSVRRHVYTEDGDIKEFVSGYSDTVCPLVNLDLLNSDPD